MQVCPWQAKETGVAYRVLSPVQIKYSAESLSHYSMQEIIMTEKYSPNLALVVSKLGFGLIQFTFSFNELGKESALSPFL